MIETNVSSAKQEVLIGHSQPTVIIGERINPTGKKKLAAALKNGNIEVLLKEAIEQVDAGAGILDVNVVAPEVDEVTTLPKVIKEIAGVVDVPVCIDFSDLKALEEALKVYIGKPIVNSVTGEEKSLNETLPLVKDYGAAVIGLTIDEKGIPKEPSRRVEIAHKIVERAKALGIPREDVIIDCLVLAIGADYNAGLATLEAISKVKSELGVNQTIGGSNISFSMPNRDVLNNTFLAMAILHGVTCPTVDVAKANMTVLASDLIMGRDRFGQHYLKEFRKQSKNQKPSRL